MDLNCPDQKQDLVAETQDVLEDVVIINDTQIVLVYNHDVHSVLYIYDLVGGNLISEVNLLIIGTANVVANYKPNNQEFFYSLTSFLSPGMIYHHNLSSKDSILFRQTQVPGFDPDQFQTKQVFYPSQDGTLIPMYIVSKKILDQVESLQNREPQPYCLYGYGGFNFSNQP